MVFFFYYNHRYHHCHCYPTTIPLPGTIIPPYCPISCAGALPLYMCSFMNHLFRSRNGILSDTSPTIAWPCQLLSQSVWLYYHHQWCSFMNHLFRGLNVIFISPGFMIHLNICGNMNTVENYWNHITKVVLHCGFKFQFEPNVGAHFGILMGIFDGNP